MKYWAFLSYSHTDKKWGDWLHKGLETYRVPRRLIGKESRDGKVPERVYPVFRDREELPVSADLGSNINEALRESRYLIVICSPRSAQSRWVGEEIKTFKKLGREDRILALIVDGEPNASDGKPGFSVEDECFPEAMRYRMVDGEPSEVRSEPIAADAREGKDGRHNAKLKLLAGLLGVNYDDLKQREQERRLRRARIVVASAVVLIGIFAVLSVALFFKEREATRARDEAQATLSRTYFLQAVRSVDEDRDLDALARLARSVSLNPRNNAAVCRLTTLLADRVYAIPLSHWKHDSSLKILQISSDGKRIVAMSEDNTTRVWDAETGRPVTEPMRHSKPVRLANFSRDGTRILTLIDNWSVGEDTIAKPESVARVWDAATGKPVSEPMIQDSHGGASAQFSPDGNYIVIRSFDGIARVWNVATSKPLTQPMKHVKAPTDYSSAIYAAEFSPDGKRIVTASQDKTARVWDAATGNPLTEPINHDDAVMEAHFSLEGDSVLTVSGKTVRVWSAATGKLLGEPMNHDGHVYTAQFSPDGKKVVTTSVGASGASIGTARIWDAQSGKPLTDPMKQDGAVWHAQFSPDSKRIVTSSSEKTARIWDAATGKPLTDPMKHNGGAVQFSPDGERVMNFTFYGQVRIWDVRLGKSLPLKLSLRSAHFSPDSKRIVIVTDTGDRVAGVCDAATGNPLTEPMVHNGGITSAEFSPDGKRVVTASRDKTARVWDATTGKPLTQPMKHQREVISAQFSPDGKRVVTSSYDSLTKSGELRVWDSLTGKSLIEPARLEGITIKGQFSPDRKRIVTVSIAEVGGISQGVTQIWDAETGTPFRDPMKGVSHAEFSPDGKQIVTGSGNYTARVWDVETGKPLTNPMEHKYSIGSVHFSPDGTQIVTAAGDVQVWDAKAGKPLTDPMVYDKAISSARFSADAKRIITISINGGVQIWDAEMCKPLTEIMKFESGTKHAEFSPDGKRVMSVSFSGEARIWDIAPAGEVPPQWLSTLADAIAGQHLNERGFLEPLTKDADDALTEIKEQLSRQSANDDWVIWGRWFLADHSTRTISPFSKITVPEYIENRIKENTAESLDEAEQLAIGNAELLERIARSRGALSQPSPLPSLPPNPFGR